MTTKPNLTRVWASGAPGGNIEDPDVTVSGKFAAGWEAEIPPFQNFNFLQQLFTQGLAHANEFGIMQWDTNTQYPQHGWARSTVDGDVYVALSATQGNEPSVSPAQWKSLTDVISIELASQAEAEAGTENTKAMTPLRVKQAVDFYGVRNDLQNETVSAGLTISKLTPSSALGGKLVLEAGDTGPTITGNVVVDLSGDRLRIYESGGTARGVELNISEQAVNSGSDILTTAASLGHGQTYQVVTGSRSSGVTYTNTTGQPILVYIYDTTTILTVTVGGVAVTNVTGNNAPSTSFIVPAGATYAVTMIGTYIWSELR